MEAGPHSLTFGALTLPAATPAHPLLCPPGARVRGYLLHSFTGMVPGAFRIVWLRHGGSGTSCYPFPLRQSPVYPTSVPRAALPDLDPSLEVVYVLNCAHDGSPLTPSPSELLSRLGKAGSRRPEWVLVDSAQVGRACRCSGVFVVVDCHPCVVVGPNCCLTLEITVFLHVVNQVCTASMLPGRLRSGTGLVQSAGSREGGGHPGVAAGGGPQP